MPLHAAYWRNNVVIRDMLLHANATNLNAVQAVSHNYIIFTNCVLALPLPLTYSLFGGLIMMKLMCNNSIDKYINTNKAFHVSNNCKMGTNFLSSSWKMNSFSVAIKIIAHFQVCIISMNALYVCDVPKKLEVFSVKKN